MKYHHSNLTASIFIDIIWSTMIRNKLQRLYYSIFFNPYTKYHFVFRPCYNTKKSGNLWILCSFCLYWSFWNLHVEGWSIQNKSGSVWAMAFELCLSDHCLPSIQVTRIYHTVTSIRSKLHSTITELMMEVQPSMAATEQCQQCTQCGSTNRLVA